MIIDAMHFFKFFYLSQMGTLTRFADYAIVRVLIIVCNTNFKGFTP